MSGKTMLIFDEEAYASALSDYFNREKENEMVSLVFSDKKKLMEYVERNKSAYILINEALLDDEIEGILDESNRILLCENRSGEKNGAWIYKYQSAKVILKEIRAFIFEYEDESKMNQEKIYAVFSTFSGIERNEYVKAVYRDLAENAAVLYLDMEPFPVDRSLEEGFGRGVSELIYYLKKGGTDLKWKIKSLIQRDGPSGKINPSKCSLDLNELNKEDIHLLVKVLKEMIEYDVVLMHIGFYTPSVVEIFRYCNKVDLVVTNHPFDRESANYFIEQMKMMKVKEVERRIQIVEFERGTLL